MAYLLVVGAGTVHEIPTEGMVIGRDHQCDLVLASADVSPRHARVARLNGGYVIAGDCTSGVFVNGERADGARPLADGDEIRAGDVVLRFGAGSAGALTEKSARPGKHEAATTPMLLATLEVVEGRVPRGMRFPLERPVAQIGRAPTSDVCLLDDTISGAHATLMLRGRTWYLLDHSSFNGSFVDGVRVSQCALPGPCELRFGAVTLRFRPVAS